MSDDKSQPNAGDHPEQPKPQPIGQQAQQGQGNTASPPGQRAAPGRRPLFRN